MTMAALRSGHSHEDIDQVFGRLAGYLHKQPTALTPSEFVPLIQDFMDTSESFTFEPYREAFEINRVRDWFLACVGILSLHLTNSADVVLRRGFLAQAVPGAIKGISGPGAPHWFEFRRRICWGALA